MTCNTGLRQTRSEIINAVREDPVLEPREKETSLGFTKPDDEVHIFTEEAGIARRLLKHPEFVAVELRINTADAWGCRLSPCDYSEGIVTGVRGYIPIGVLKVMARSRSASGHAEIVSTTAATITDE